MSTNGHDLQTEVERNAAKIETLRSLVNTDETDDGGHEDCVSREEFEEVLGRVAALEQQLEGLAGIADDAASTSKTRARDLTQALRRKAEASDDGLSMMDYADIKDELTTLGHGTVYDQQAYRAMEYVAEHVPGASLGTFNEKRVVRMNLEAYRRKSGALGGQRPSNNVNRRNSGVAAANNGETNDADV